MSKAWIPKQLYLFEQANIEQGRGTLWDLMDQMTVTIGGETFPVYSKEAISRQEQYPLLGSLFDLFDTLYSFLSQVNGGLDLLARHEKDLGTYIHTGQGTRNLR